MCQQRHSLRQHRDLLRLAEHLNALHARVDERHLEVLTRRRGRRRGLHRLHVELVEEIASGLAEGIWH